MSHVSKGCYNESMEVHTQSIKVYIPYSEAFTFLGSAAFYCMNVHGLTVVPIIGGIE